MIYNMLLGSFPLVTPANNYRFRGFEELYTFVI